MKKSAIKFSFLIVIAIAIFGDANAQTKRRTVTRRAATSKTAKGKTKANIQTSNASADTAKAVVQTKAPSVDTLPFKRVLPSLRPDEAVESSMLRDRTPLAYEVLRADDALFRHKIWREIDTREKINLPFRYAADEDNGNQRLISIIFKAIQDSEVTVFNPIDDRFTTPMTMSEVGNAIAGAEVPVPIIDSNGVQTGVIYKRNEVNLDSFYKFHIKEEVIFDKKSSRLFWRILGIAPVKRIVTSTGLDLGENELFWVYFPDMRPVFAKYEVYNGKNFGARMSWDDLFENRMFYGRIIKSTMDNAGDRLIRNYVGLGDKPILQLMEGQKIHDKIFTYEQDLWSY